MCAKCGEGVRLSVKLNKITDIVENAKWKPFQ